MKKIKLLIIILLALFITVAFAIYQRLTGPTHPKRVKVEIDSKEYRFKLSRSAVITDNRRGEHIISLDFLEENDIEGYILYRKYPPLKLENGEYQMYDTIPLLKENTKLLADLPSQGKAGKLQYYIELIKGGKAYSILNEDPIVIRFRGDVPAYVIIPHIISMFSSMFFAMMCFLSMFFYKDDNRRVLLYGKVSLSFLIVGGLVLGLFVQYYAFDVYWAGFPFAWDLTDNKTLIAVIVWILALLFNRKVYRPKLLVIAIIIMFVVFGIPHSMNGSQRNPETGEMEYN